MESNEHFQLSMAEKLCNLHNVSLLDCSTKPTHKKNPLRTSVFSYKGNLLINGIKLNFRQGTCVLVKKRRAKLTEHHEQQIGRQAQTERVQELFVWCYVTLGLFQSWFIFVSGKSLCKMSVVYLSTSNWLALHNRTLWTQFPAVMYDEMTVYWIKLRIIKLFHWICEIQSSAETTPINFRV